SLLSRKLKSACVICQQTSGISASKIGSSACRCVLIFVENASKNNKVIYNYLPCCFISICKT
ncbi:unnamed protein product, partial [Acanthoscelides obtectus]